VDASTAGSMADMPGSRRRRSRSRSRIIAQWRSRAHAWQGREQCAWLWALAGCPHPGLLAGIKQPVMIGWPWPDRHIYPRRRPRNPRRRSQRERETERGRLEWSRGGEEKHTAWLRRPLGPWMAGLDHSMTQQTTKEKHVWVCLVAWTRVYGPAWPVQSRPVPRVRMTMLVSLID
jgi:hypothetical protein